MALNLKVEAIKGEIPCSVTATIGELRGAVWYWINLKDIRGKFCGGKSGPVVGPIPTEFQIEVKTTNRTITFSTRKIKRRKKKEGPDERMKYVVKKVNQTPTAGKYTATHPNATQPSAAPAVPHPIPPPPAYPSEQEPMVLKKLAVLKYRRNDSSPEGRQYYDQAYMWLLNRMPDSHIQAKLAR